MIDDLMEDSGYAVQSLARDVLKLNGTDELYDKLRNAFAFLTHFSESFAVLPEKRSHVLLEIEDRICYVDQILAFVLTLPHDQSLNAFGDRAFQCLKAFADVFRRLIRLPRQRFNFRSNTANPRPGTPALAASIVAFSASIFVRRATLRIL